jgi:phosphoesterase RecJ-like protein
MSTQISLQETRQLLEKANTIILVSHIGPDGDTLGSTLALKEALEQMGKKVTAMVDDNISSTYNFLPGIGSYVTPKEGDKFKVDLLVIIDASSLDRAGIIPSCVDAPHMLNIDHHISNTHYAEYLWLDDKAAATGEIILSLLKELPITITKSMAICLYVAIATDCGYFKYSNTTAQTMRSAAELLEYGIEPNTISDALELKSKATINLLKIVLNTITYYGNGRIATIEITHENYDESVDTDSFIYYPRYIEGVDVAVSFKAVESKVTRVSMRSRSLDVSKIALAFNGGGHKRAAGCTIYLPLPQAKEKLLEALEKGLETSHD